MASKVFVLLVAAFVAVAVEASLAPSARLRGGLRALVDDPECASKRQLTCSDCKTQVRCDKVGGVWFYLGTNTCGGTTPYCEPVNGTCTGDVSLVDDKCTEPEPVNTFNCPSDGYWPDVTNCAKYYICSDGKAYAYDCSSFGNAVYDHKSSSCLARSEATCVTLTCRSPGSFVAYNPDPSIYSFCRSTNSSEAAVLKCEEGRTFSTINNECQVACTKAGRIALADKKRFYDCVDLGNGRMSQPTPGRCPGTSEFNPSLGRCAEKGAPVVTTPAPRTTTRAPTTVP
ncbi:uncharacterized protein LOC117651751 [Thrips palmi]|uniref:Uncharacterized protein LOC117651751 n=1 Tax=Thrips palmi TaxID=161013 RepID=A0A6P9A3C8_THRPL|nr:uncharacterized protein LOC117651751 [Thrips palmi]